MDMIQKMKMESDLQIVAKVNGRDVTRCELSAAFDLVADPSNWKMPIDKTLDLQPYQIPLIHEAVNFFAGGGAEFDWHGRDAESKFRFRVRAPGYYRQIGA